MKTKAAIILLGLLLWPTLSAADLLLSNPRVGQKTDNKVELGASPEITIQYKNTTGQDVELASVDIFLTYDPKLVRLIGIINKNPNYLLVRAEETYTAGLIRYKMTVSTAKPKFLKAWPGRTVDLATIVFHVEQTAQPGGYVRLLNWDQQSPSVILSPEPFNITGNLIEPARIYLAGSQPPEFKGLNLVTSANTLGKQNPGNTLVLDWRTAAGAFDQTKYYGGKLSYRIWRRTKGNQWQELPGQQPTHNPGSDPFDRVPYTGNTNSDYLYEDKKLNDGETYEYKVTALDDTSPTPNEQSSTAVMTGLPLDLTPPQEVTDLSTSVGDRQITLNWKNPPDPDLGGVLVMVNETRPVGEGFLGQATNNGSGPVYQPGDQPFGEGKGFVMYVSPSGAVPTSFTDIYPVNGARTYYKIFTFDRETNGPPREFGRNYSQGVDISDVAGIAPKPIANFQAEVGEYPGEILMLWNNSLDDFVGGTLVRFNDNDQSKFSVLKNERTGRLLEAFPIYGGPSELDGYYISGFIPEKTYYFKAYAYNQTPEPLDPADPGSMANHKFSEERTVSLYLPKIETEAAAGSEGIRPGATDVEPKPQLKIWFNNRLYRQGLVDKGLPFYVPPKPKIKVEISIAQPYKLDQRKANYTFNIDGKTTYSYGTAKIQESSAELERDLTQELTPGEHTFAFSAQSAGDRLASSSVAQKVTVTATGGELKLLDRPLAFPSPFNPEKDKQITLQYTLTKDSDIDIIIVDISGQIIKKIPISAGTEGGTAHLNKVIWDGMTEQGTIVSSGLYLVNIVSREEKKSLGKIKITVFR